MASITSLWRANKPAEITPSPPAARPDLSDFDRRARAFARVFPLLSTSIPTPEILRSYHDEIARP